MKTFGYLCKILTGQSLVSLAWKRLRLSIGDAESIGGQLVRVVVLFVAQAESHVHFLVIGEVVDALFLILGIDTVKQLGIYVKHILPLNRMFTHSMIRIAMRKVNCIKLSTTKFLYGLVC